MTHNPEVAKILLVDDDDDLRRAVNMILQQNNYEVVQAVSGAEALERYQGVDLVILDVMLPVVDGFEVCRRIREQSTVPIILLTARGDIIDKRVGFNFGADDYLVKPFDMDELLLRIRVIIRRMAFLPAEQLLNSKECIRVGELTLDHSARTTTVRGTEVHLTATEFNLLWLMAESAGRVFTRKQLFELVWDEDLAGDPRTITVLIRRIREKIEQDPARPEYVLTVWGVGYKFG